MYKEFYEIVKDILNTKEFKRLKMESHHGTSRYIHSLRVAMRMYEVTKKRHLNYVEATRAALLHDFFSTRELNTKLLAQSYEHPKLAFNNASKYFYLNKKQENIILCHMFPLAKTMPKSKEAWFITLVDKKIAIHEYKNYKYSVTNIKKKVSKLSKKLIRTSNA